MQPLQPTPVNILQEFYALIKGRQVNDSSMPLNELEGGQSQVTTAGTYLVNSSEVDR